ncbi:hypothetical protein CPI83_15865 [Rhodococcus sp. H-CA8f]|nr:hypothetical protein CPI83_15865 [Rhodococcus sp. H-CA8f]KIM16345.1 hypothetical protein QV65_14860 [Rhodococcus erythropolis]ORI20376.1 hypothetical protein BH686_11430 [Rhodococcus erythropolis]
MSGDEPSRRHRRKPHSKRVLMAVLTPAGEVSLFSHPADLHANCLRNVRHVGAMVGQPGVSSGMLETS